MSTYMSTLCRILPKDVPRWCRLQVVCRCVIDTNGSQQMPTPLWGRVSLCHTTTNISSVDAQAGADTHCRLVGLHTFDYMIP